MLPCSRWGEQSHLMYLRNRYDFNKDTMSYRMAQIPYFCWRKKVLSQREGTETSPSQTDDLCHEATRTLAQPECAQLIYGFSALPELR